MSTLSKVSLDSFLTACGAAGPITLTVEGPEPGEMRSRVLEQPFAVIGRDPRADICLDEWHVSRRHAFLQLIDGQWFCVDLQSQTGTHWANGQQRTGWVDAAHGIQVGRFRIRAGSAPAEIPVVADPLNDRVPELLFLPGVTLDFLAGGLQQSNWRMSRLLALVGQAPECKVRLVAPSVSKFHCALVRTRLGLWVVDLFGRNGVRVNGQSVRSALLLEGDLIEVGQFVVRVRYNVPLPPRENENHATVDVPTPKPHVPEAMPNGSMMNGEPDMTAGLNPLVLADGRPGVLLPSDRTATEAEVVERLLVPLVNEFRLMQQQMFDQFQQAMSSMFNMFTSMHREQTDLIRDELDRLHELTRELHTIQEQMAKLPPQPAAAAPKPAATAPRPQPAPVPQPAAAPQPASPRPPQPQDDAQTGNPEHIHLWLSQRMAAIQKERQSSWQKILNFLMGKTS